MAWHAQATGGYARTSTEAIENATLLAQACYNIGWCKASVCAMLGNGAGESGLNPWRWQSDYVPTRSEMQAWTYNQSLQHGYGLFQFTPANKYINSTNASALSSYGYAPNFQDHAGNASDGNAQTVFFCGEVPNDWRPTDLYGYYYDDFINIGVDISGWYYTNYNPFILGQDNNGNTLTLYELVGVFELNYERPGDTYAASSYSYRCDNADYWWSTLPDPHPSIFQPWFLWMITTRYKRRWKFL